MNVKLMTAEQIADAIEQGHAAMGTPADLAAAHDILRRRLEVRICRLELGLRRVLRDRRESYKVLAEVVACLGPEVVEEVDKHA